MKPKSDIKARILAVAEELFAQRGFDATGIDLIAQTAGITKSLIYYYFKSKDEILAELFQNFITETIDLKKQIVRETNWAEQMRHDIAAILREYTLPFLMSHKNIVKIAFRESVKDAPEVPHLNIFKYFDQNFMAGLELATQGGAEVNPETAKLGGFFLLWAPLFSFVIFSDEWCEYYRCDLQEITDRFVMIYGASFQTMLGNQDNNNPIAVNGHLKTKP